MTKDEQVELLLAAAIKVRDGLDRGDHPGPFASILDAAIATCQAATWQDKAARGDHPGRSFCLDQAKAWQRRAVERTNA